LDLNNFAFEYFEEELRKELDKEEGPGAETQEVWEKPHENLIKR